MRIQHTHGRRPPPVKKPRSSSSKGLIRLLTAVLLFLAAFSGRTLLPQASEPVFQALEILLTTDMDLNQLSKQAGDILKGAGSGIAVFQEIPGLGARDEASVSLSSPHLLSEVNWLNQISSPRDLLDHYLPSRSEQEKPQWLP